MVTATHEPLAPTVAPEAAQPAVTQALPPLDERLF